MSDSYGIRASRLGSLFMGGGALALVVMIVMYPDQAFDASMKGLSIWWKFVFPALLPFFVLSELMRAYGVVHGLGVLLEPLMRTLFRIPGIGGWALALGMTAGSPSGAEATAALRREGLITRAEGERLLSLSHLNSPVFLIVVVGAGFFGQPQLGVAIAVIHLVSGLAAGTAMRLYRGGEALEATSLARAQRKVSFPARLLHAIEDARRKDGRPFGRLLGEAVFQSVQSLLVIGGYIIMFSVFLKVAFLTYTAYIVQIALIHLLEPIGMTQQAAHQWISALFELHLGAFALSQPSGMGSAAVAGLLAAGIAWSGLCLHAQVRSLIRGTDLRYGPFLLGRLVHMALSLPLTALLWEPLNRWLEPSTAAWGPMTWALPFDEPAAGIAFTPAMALDALGLLTLCLLILLTLSAGAAAALRLLAPIRSRT